MASNAYACQTFWFAVCNAWRHYGLWPRAVWGLGPHLLNTSLHIFGPVTEYQWHASQEPGMVLGTLVHSSILVCVSKEVSCRWDYWTVITRYTLSSDMSLCLYIHVTLRSHWSSASTKLPLASSHFYFSSVTSCVLPQGDAWLWW